MSWHRLTSGVVAAAVVLFAAGEPTWAMKNENPGVLPVHSSPHGGSYGEWASAWWQWALSIPAATNPVADATGEFCAEGQEGPVWFIAGTFGNSAERWCTVPAGKTLFMPVYNWIFGAGVYDCEPSVPGVPCEEDVLRAAAAASADTAEVLEMTIDGVPVEGLFGYRADSPETFAVELPEGNVLGLPAGSYDPHVADGFWLALAPLSKGEHTLQWYVLAPGTIFGTIEFTVTLHLTVE